MSSDELPALSIEANRTAGAMELTVTGEIDMASAPRVDEELRSVIDSGSAVLLNLEHVTFIDSSGLRVLVGARQHAQDAAVGFAVSGRSAALDRLLEVTGLDEVFLSEL